MQSRLAIESLGSNIIKESAVLYLLLVTPIYMNPEERAQVLGAAKRAIRAGQNRTELEAEIHPWQMYLWSKTTKRLPLEAR